MYINHTVKYYFCFSAYNSIKTADKTIPAGRFDGRWRFDNPVGDVIQRTLRLFIALLERIQLRRMPLDDTREVSNWSAAIPASAATCRASAQRPIAVVATVLVTPCDMSFWSA